MTEKKLTHIRQPLQKTPIVSKWYSNTAQIIANHFSLLQSQGNVSIIVRLLHGFVRQSWHLTAQIMFLNHRKNVEVCSSPKGPVRSSPAHAQRSTPQKVRRSSAHSAHSGFFQTPPILPRHSVDVHSLDGPGILQPASNMEPARQMKNMHDKLLQRSSHRACL